MLINAIILVVVLSGLLQEKPTPPAASPDITVTELKIGKTPEVHAICLAGKGDTSAYSDVAKRLYGYLLALDLKPQGSLFASTWIPGPDPKSPKDGAVWDVCAGLQSPPNDVAAPFVLKDVETQDAGHAICESAPGNLGKCFAAVEQFVTKSGRTPFLPPRYSIVKGNESDKTLTYEVWLPVNPGSAAGQTPQK
jgi:hypothetical protein